MPNNKHHWLYGLTGVACVASLYAALGHPSEYGFYTLARVAVTIAAVTIAVSLQDKSRDGLRIACIVTAILFNPVIPLELGRKLWVMLDIAVVPLLIYATSEVVAVSRDEEQKGDMQ